ncbi:amino acid aminotransferase [Marinobacterium arenosum]|uniref:amino acid aminotransferase n=1 Tax=Marinobacterium arenosum TaxID=2862496 RepID=UPI001C95205B|nr:amino acid aminotransferase [Marinobacterium arenosum]MBY4677547.1 aspartate/tyrosine/aromatic aminotransferase [Marinobacterium arenosum]
MFEHLKALPQDPILQLMLQYRADERSNKIDLGIGIYKDEQGNTPVMQAVKLAEQRLLEQETSKSYIGPAGSEGYNNAVAELLLGTGNPLLSSGRLTYAQTPGGCGALRMAAEFLKRCNADTRIWVSNPTWGNHIPLLGGAGLAIEQYRYYDKNTHGVAFDEMMEDLKQARAGDVVLLHGCCHNPSGADLSLEQWQAVSDLVVEKGLLPFVDIAYQGLGQGLDQDAAGLRLIAAAVPEMVVAASCSKNFGLYRERTGFLMLLSANAEQAANSASQLFSTIRSHYSMPPSHGAAVVETILGDAELRQNWQQELDGMTHRILNLRQQLVQQMALRDLDMAFIAQQQGMFSFLGLSPEQVARMKQEHAIYMVDSSRVNVAGLNSNNIETIADALAKVIKQ